MNKVVEVTGLQMTATTSNSIEVSLGKVTSEGKTITVSAIPEDDATEISWKRSIAVGEYYKTVGKMRPASTEDCATMYDATDVSNAGQTASNFKVVTDRTTLTPHETYSDSNALSTIADNDSGAEDAKGYWIDIPVHLRTNMVKSDKKAKAAINCKMKIGNVGSENTELYKAVRVAFISDTDQNAIVSEGETSASVWGADKNYYATGPVTDENTKATGAPTILDADGKTAGDTGLTIDLPETGAYGHCNFIVRVWLEGESTYCQDKNAAQKWQIDMRFALDDETIPNIGEDLS